MANTCKNNGGILSWALIALALASSSLAEAAPARQGTEPSLVRDVYYELNRIVKKSGNGWNGEYRDGDETVSTKTNKPFFDKESGFYRIYTQQHFLDLDIRTIGVVSISKQDCEQGFGTIEREARLTDTGDMFKPHNTIFDLTRFDMRQQGKSIHERSDDFAGTHEWLSVMLCKGPYGEDPMTLKTDP